MPGADQRLVIGQHLAQREVDAPRIGHGVVETRIHQERITAINEYGGACRWAVRWQHPFTFHVDPTPACRCRVAVRTGEIDELDLGQVAAHVLDELPVAKLKPQPQRVVPEVCPPHALPHALQIYRAVEARVGYDLCDRKVRVARADGEDVALVTRHRPEPLGSRGGHLPAGLEVSAVSNAFARYRADAVDVGWSKTAVVDNFKPVADLSRFRNSTAPSESNPNSLTLVRAHRIGGIVTEHRRGVRTDDRQRSAIRSDSVIAARRWRRTDEDSAAATGSAARRAVRTRLRNIGGRPPADAGCDWMVARSNCAGTMKERGCLSAASKSARPCWDDIGMKTGAPHSRAIAFVEVARHPGGRAHLVHAIETPGSPWWRRCWASPSRNALAAA